MSNNVKISQVVIEVGGNRFELTLDEAKSLQDILNNTFPKQQTTYIPYPQPYPVYPRPWRDNWWTVQYKTTSGAEVMTLCANNGGVK